MCDERTLAAFVVACIAVILAPGPAQALVLARTLGQGRRTGILTVVGLNAATPVHGLAAGLGVSVLLARSAFAFGLVKLVGAAYLVYLGAKALVVAGREPRAEARAPLATRRALLQAFVTGILNPKVALFFLAFLPQFVCPARGSVLLQFVALGSALGILDVCYESALVLLASGASSRLAAPRLTTWRSRFTGGVLLGLGLKLAFVERR